MSFLTLISICLINATAEDAGVFCLTTGPAPLHWCQLVLDRSTDAPLVGGQGSGQEGCPGVLLNLSAPKCQRDRPEEGGIKIFLSPRDGLIRVSAKKNLASFVQS